MINAQQNNNPTPRVILIMADGIGVPPEGWQNSVYARCCPPAFVELLETHAVSVDATLGVPGTPQSATGQTALFTGVNAAAVVNAHVQGFPGPTLRKIITSGNLFKHLLACGRSVTFANAYVRHTLEELAAKRCQSVTTVMTASALGHVRTRADLLAGRAVFHDLTRDSLDAQFDVPVVTSETAAEHLLAVSREHDLTLFEYFLTDKAGHAGREDLLQIALERFGRFFVRLVEALPPGTRLVLCSDHGNCEDLTTPGHTLNPVPLVAIGRPPVDLAGMRSILQLHDLVAGILAEH